MNSKITGAVILMFFPCTAHPAAAQVSQFLNTSTPTPSLPKTEPPTATSAILIRVIEANKNPFAGQALVQLLSVRTQSSVYAATEQNGEATFDGLQPGRYTIKVSAAGYRTTQSTADISPRHSHYESVVELHRDPSAIAIISHGSSRPTSSAVDGEAEHSTKLQVATVDEASGWRPIGVDSEKLLTALDTPCPCQDVLNGVSHRAEEFVDNINRFAATERLVAEDLNAEGKVVETERRKFDYVVSIAKLNSGDLDVDEFRNGYDTYAGFPDQIATLGLPSLAFVFHPKYRDDYNFACEGLGAWQGHAAWLVYFSQRPDKPARIRGYSVNNVLYPVSLKGRAWIAADSLQVMRMEADIMHPLPKIKLRDEHQVVEYKPVSFHTRNVEMWLPDNAEVYFDFRGHKYHRVHSFSDYLLFSVSASEKIGMPKGYDSQ
jgi:hypothetical protein